MRQALLYLSLGLLGGFAVSAWWPDVETQPFIDTTDTDASRIATLERELRAQIRTLDSEVAALRRDLARYIQTGDDLESRSDEESAALTAERRAAAIDERDQRADETSVAELAAGNVPGGLRERRFRLRSPEGRLEALTEAGFTLDRAQQIEQRLEELRVDAMQARYDAARRGELSGNAPVEAVFNINEILREELGDADYERYLTAMGQSTHVEVRSVLASSAAQQAGLEPGDEIVAYGGQRVFDVRELNQALLEGEPGEPVLVDVVRDGQPLQLVMPRGPLGITGGFAPGGRGR